MRLISLIFFLILVVVSLVEAADRPHILWITSEDNGPHLGCYGDEYAVTPHLDALAARGMRYSNCSSNAPVCAPARTTLISGIYPTATGGHHMRSMVPLPAGVSLYPQMLREAGYFCTNKSKEDYNVEKRGQVWDQGNHWKSRPEGKPFFAIFNHTISHESQIRNQIDPANLIHDPAKVSLPGYHPDTPEVRKDWAQYYDRLTMMDALAGKNLAELEEAGLTGDTIVFYYGDHGSGMPRSKRWPYRSGLQVPLIVFVPEKWKDLAPGDYKAGGSSDRPVGFIDMAPTLLSIVGVEIPEWMDGHAFMGNTPAEPRAFNFGFRGRMDERYDCVRSVTDGRYMYLRQFMPHREYGQFISYMFQTPTTRVWKEKFDAGELNEAQSRFWMPKESEELYDLETDPHETVNLADDPAHAKTLAKLRDACRDWILETRDIGFLPEDELHTRAAKSGLTPYEIGQSEEQYDLESVFRAADLASSTDPDPAKVRALLESKDSAVRYWGANGMLIRGGRNEGLEAGDLKALRPLLKDESGTVRSVAAEALGKFGTPEDLEAALKVLVAEADPEGASFYRALFALNAIDYLDEKARPALDSIRNLSTKASMSRGGAYLPNLHSKIFGDLGEKPAPSEKKKKRKK